MLTNIKFSRICLQILEFFANIAPKNLPAGKSNIMITVFTNFIDCYVQENLISIFFLFERL